MLVIGGGIIGLEMATVYSTLGVRIDVVEMLDGLMPGADRDLVKLWEKRNAGRFENVMLKTKTVGGRGNVAGHQGRLRGREGAEGAAALRPRARRGGAQPERQADRRREGGRRRDRARLHPGRQADAHQRAHIFAIGDIVGQPMLAHKAVHEGACRRRSRLGAEEAYFDARQIPSVAYTDPEVAWAGLTEDEAKATGHQVRQGGRSRGPRRPR